jgi:hypothetical protein
MRPAARRALGSPCRSSCRCQAAATRAATTADGSPADVVQRVAEELEVELSEEALTALLDELGPAQGA